MPATSSSLDRRGFPASSTAQGAASLLPAAARAATQDGAIRPFHIDVPDGALVDLRRRITTTCWPERETVADESQGVPLATMQEVARYWGTDCDWRKIEARLNALPQFITEIDGLDIHFIHVRSKHENALPLIVTHGWPGSIIEQLKTIDPLTNPTVHGGTALDPFHLVIPSMPGYGCSGKPTTTGWDPAHIARAWIVLMKRLGYTQFVAQGGDWGSLVSSEMAKLAPPELLGIHVNLPGVVPPEIMKALQSGDPAPTSLSDDERRAFEQLNKVSFSIRRAYAQIMGTRPQTLSGLADSPAGLAAWLLDHGDGYAQPAAAITSAVLGHTTNGHTAGDLKRLTMPVLALGGSDGVGDALRATIASTGDHVQGGTIGPGCGHFLPEECPDELTEAISSSGSRRPESTERLRALGPHSQQPQTAPDA